MSVRSELEGRLATFATAQNIPVSWEGVPFTPPSSGPYLQAVMLASATKNSTVDATRTRTTGNFQINVVGFDGLGSKQVEDLATLVVALYPVMPKAGTVSIESPPQTGAAILLTGKRIIPITIAYRQEN